MVEVIIYAATILAALAFVGYVALSAYSDRQFEKRYREFKRQQRINRDRFFSQH